ncbi:MAG TPA: hypothetical protein VMY37_02305 [Thermoguttaceae bacterium]|nr:hypothetical protein [Thermoguttaceae bacterium]
MSIDTSRNRDGNRGSLKIGPGGKAVLRLRDTDESGRVEVWVFDDGATPEDVKAHRAGPRWGLVQSDGKALVIGALYADYLGGDEGYTASDCDGKDWFDKLFWLGVRRRPAGIVGPSTSIPKPACKCCTMDTRSRRSTPERSV